jgi:SpoVK/Ycf46/Vps4 family AAA+-type ATPase
MLKSSILDEAVATAKSYSHPAVEPRHLLYAAARRFRARPEIEALLPKARASLEPRGSALTVPELNPEAAALLEKFSTEAATVAVLLEQLSGGPAPDGADKPSGATVTETQAGAAAAAPAPTQPPAETVAAVLAELERLVGLNTVKRQLANVIAVVQANQERSKAGMAQVTPGLHLVFTGPPGTGKTTVARLVARLYAAAGALPGSNFTEVGRADLVAGYVGQTAIKTAEVISKTRPGVLFIDEAYSLTPTHGTDFGAEAISTLVKSMEDHRTDFAVIAAGYGDEMTEFVGSNPGLKSRFKTFIDFPNYSSEELLTIFSSFAEASAITLGDGVLEAAESVFRRAVTKRDFGNARFARSLFEQAYARMAGRAVADGTLTVDEVTTISKSDIEWLENPTERPDHPIGFRRA